MADLEARGSPQRSFWRFCRPQKCDRRALEAPSGVFRSSFEASLHVDKHIFSQIKIFGGFQRQFLEDVSSGITVLARAARGRVDLRFLGSQGEDTEGGDSNTRLQDP